MTIPRFRHPCGPTPPVSYALIWLALWASLLLQPARASQAPASVKKPLKPYALIYGTVFGPDAHAVYGVRIKIRPANEHYVRTRLVCLENTHNRGGGRIYPMEKIEAISAWASV